MKARILNVNCDVTIDPNKNIDRFKTFKNIESLVKDMVNRDVVYKSANIGTDFISVKIDLVASMGENNYNEFMEPANTDKKFNAFL